MANELLIEEGDEASRIFHVVSGSVALFLTTEQGHEVEVGERSAGDLVGSEALVSGVYECSARALRRCRVRALKRCDVMNALERDPALRVDLLNETLRELGRTRNRLLDLAGRCARERLELALARSAVVTDGRPLVLLPWGSKARLARKLGIAQETFSRVFQDLIEEKCVRVVPGGVELLNINQPLRRNI